MISVSVLMLSISQKRGVLLMSGRYMRFLMTRLMSRLFMYRCSFWFRVRLPWHALSRLPSSTGFRGTSGSIYIFLMYSSMDVSMFPSSGQAHWTSAEQLLHLCMVGVNRPVIRYSFLKLSLFWWYCNKMKDQILSFCIW